jgi:drug/metabolite transporter (DMT)-like permease
MTTPEQSSDRTALLWLIFGAVCISFAPVFVKLIGETRLGPTAIGFWRTLFGAAALFVLALARGGRLWMSARLFRFSVLAGFIFFLDLFIWHRSIIYCGAGMATILANTQVFATGLLSFLIFSDRLSTRYFIAAGSGIIGVVLLVGVISTEVQFTSRYLHGVVLGLITGLVYANYLITLKWTGSRVGIPDIVTFIAWTSLFSSCFLGISAAIESVPILPPDPATWFYLVALGVVAQALGWWAITSSLARIVASRAGLVLLLQPTLAMVWGVMIFAEQFTFMQLVGAVITLTAIYYGGLRQSRPKVPAATP